MQIVLACCYNIIRQSGSLSQPRSVLPSSISLNIATHTFLVNLVIPTVVCQTTVVDQLYTNGIPDTLTYVKHSLHCKPCQILTNNAPTCQPLTGKWARGGWAASDEDEKRIKEETQATLRCFPFDQPAGPHSCLMTGKPADEVAIFAKSY